MKLPVFIVFVFYTLYYTTETGFSQQLADEVQSMLSGADQKKLTKLDETYTKGDLILSKAAYPGDESLLNSLTPESKLNKKHFTKRIEATDYYRVANGGKFTVYERNIKEFWKKYTGEHFKLENVKKAEVMASMLFQEAQQFRKDASKSPKLKDWLPLILKAEENEKQSLLELQKVLFVYLNYPARYNEAWFTADTVTKKTEVTVAKNEVQPVTSVTPNVPPIEIPNKSVKTGEPKAPITEKKADSSIYSMVGVDETQIDIFNRFLQNQHPKDYEKYIIDFASIDYANIQSLRNAWYKYKFGTLEDSTQYYVEHKEMAVPQDTVKQLTYVDAKDGGKSQTVMQNKNESKSVMPDTKTNPNLVVQSTMGQTNIKPDNSGIGLAKTSDKKPTADDVSGTAIISKPENRLATETLSTDKKIIAGVTTPESKLKPTNAATETNINKGTVTTSGVSEPLTSGFLYKVQIAACRQELDAAALSGIYNGKERITETMEDNWYKYTIGNFTTHNEARQLRDAISIPDAFVAAYLNGKRIKLMPSRTGEWIDESLPADIRPELIQFRVQIAASRNELSISVLKNIYNGTAEIITAYEDNWNKYSVLAGNTLGQALEMVKNTDVPGAFIVAYYNNQKINLLSAIRITN